ncbi:cobyrinic acid a,c-diamide synthase [Candidatus Pacearchaeota archaeon]|nr:MAG: cobyrinic acid a,c-diamide synthase [Candidatus Pacearchaeota archaeon]
MIPVFLISNKPFTGRNFLTLGLALNLKDKGFKIGYVKTIGKLPLKKEDKIIDEEALFIKYLLELKEPADIVSPFVFSYEAQYKLFKGEPLDAEQKIINAISCQKDKDIVFVITGDTIFEGYSLGINAIHLIEKLNGKGLIVQTWNGETSIDDILGIKDLLGEKFLGAVINKVPSEYYIFVKETIIPYLKDKGIKIFGIFKREKLLEAVTIRTLLEIVNGKIICEEEKLDELVENYLVGAMDPESAFRYFLRVPNKAVITGVSRTDIQILALETSTKCLILTGGLLPSETVINRAKTQGVPIIATTLDTFTVVDKIEKLMGKAMIKEKAKALKSKEIVAKEFDLDGFLNFLFIDK